MAGGGMPGPALQPITRKRRAEADQGVPEPDARRGDWPPKGAGGRPESRLTLAADVIEEHVIGDHLHLVLPVCYSST
jgi:hypothetical protein